MPSSTRLRRGPLLLLAALLLSATPTRGAGRVHVDELVEIAPGVRLRALTRGADESLPVLVYPPFAWTFPTIASGDHLFLRLARDFLMLTYDPRGVGGSRDTPRAASVDDYVADVVGMAEYAHRRFGAARVYALGTSTGATLVALAAQRAPHRFAHLLLNGPALNMTRQMETVHHGIHDVWRVPRWAMPYLPTPVVGVLTMLRVPFHTCRTRLICDMEFFTPLTFAGSAYYPSGGTRVFAEAALAFADLQHVAGMRTFDLWRDAPSFAVDVTMLSGEHDTYMAHVGDVAEYARAVREATREAAGAAAGAARVRHIVVPNASHAVHLEAREAFLAAARGMLDDGGDQSCGGE